MNHINLINKYLWKDIGQNYKYISRWRDYDVYIVDGLIFRFPKNKTSLQTMEQEKQKLDIVAKYVDLQVPIYTLADGFMMYPLIEWLTLDEVENNRNDKIIDDIVNFTKQLHSIPLSEFGFLQTDDDESDNWPSEFVENMKLDIAKKLHDKIPIHNINDIHKYMDELFYKFRSPEKVFVHGDLQAKNIIYDQKNDRIKWIIDFSDSRIASPELDFGHFYGASSFEKIITKYRWFFDEEFADRVFFLARRNILFEITNDDIDKNREYIYDQLKKYKYV